MGNAYTKREIRFLEEGAVMRIYFNKKDNEIIIVGKKGELPTVTFVEDRGHNYKGTNCFGNPLLRYRYHWSSIDEGYSSQTDKLDFVNTEDRVYFEKRVVKKIKVK